MSAPDGGRLPRDVARSQSAAGHAALLGVGVDVVDVTRFARVLTLRGRALTDRVFTTHELRECAGRASRLAARFAAKEAAAKALGTGIGPIRWRDVETTRQDDGPPRVHLSGEAARVAARRGAEHWSVSVAHDDHIAVAVVAASGPGPDGTSPGGEGAGR